MARFDPLVPRPALPTMLSTIDLHTLAIAVAVTCLAQTLSLLFVWRAHPDYLPARDWAVGAFFIALGECLIGLRGQVPDSLSVVLANIAVLGGAMLLASGIARAAGKAPPWRAGVALLLGASAVFFWFGVVQPHYTPRVIAFSLGVVLCDTYAAWTCTRVKTGRRAPTFHLIALLLGVIVLSCLWRAVDAVTMDRVSVFSTSPASAQLSLVAIVYTSMVTTLLVLLTAQKFQDDIDDQARHDPLTLAYNRRALDEFAEREWRRALRHNYPFTMLMVDIDEFKHCNDHHGHRCGDHVLSTVSETAQSLLRSEDIWCRYGGEEFLALLPDVDNAQAVELAERLRKAVSAIRIAGPNGAVSISVSIGVASRTPDTAEWTDIIEAADRAMYQAKSAGRNRVVPHARQAAA